MRLCTAETVLAFWFEEITPKDWFCATPELDARIRAQFGDTLEAAKRGELCDWRKTMRGRLAEIIVLDQFSRNIFREDPRAYEGDPAALLLAQEAVKQKERLLLSPMERSFLYMPFMHSESLLIQERFSLVYFEEEGLEKRCRYAKEHYQTIKLFGRFPYRNKVLGRMDTQEEKNYLLKTGA